ncbi:hypothetical protein CLIB1423_20S01002 [[Candida] railenensis]|uniref:glucan endo-1,3-beta-D-glucosidase n=1 Tax=[Candida] railenensis TaxID=45579 RepID=A0A9P0W0F1_9ASCO|nr:hypothetical protein CLIB1423_20S01002 [[Candida] railenensis]
MSNESSSQYENSISSGETPNFKAHSASVEDFILKSNTAGKAKRTGESEVKRSKSFSFWNKSYRKKKMKKVSTETEIGESQDDVKLSVYFSSPLEELNIQNQDCIVSDDKGSPDGTQSVNFLDSGEIEIQRFSTVKRNKRDLKGIERINAISPLTGASILSPLGTPSTPFYSKNSPSPLMNSLENVERMYDAYSFEPEKESTSPEVQNNRSTINTNNNERTNSRKRFILVTLLLVLSLLIIVGSFVTAVVILSQGTESTVKTYFQNANSYERYSLLSNLLKTYNFQLLSENERDERDETQVNSDLLYKKSKMAEGGKLNGFNTFEGISDKYKSDLEIRDLMVSDSFPVGRSIFYGLAYSPRGAMEPQCQVSKREVLLDMAVLSKVTCRIRNYGMQCKQSEYILDAIQELNLNMTLSLGVWIGENEVVNQNQMSELKRILKKYPVHLFESIYIGNEVLFRQEQTTEKLVEYIQEARNFAASLGYADLSVGTSEIGSLISNELIEHTDVIGVNIHSFFGGVGSERGTRWTFDFLDSQILPIVNGKSKIVITEVGWPYAGGKYKSAVASPSDFSQFLHQFVCQAYKNGYGWYYFEAFDEPWKEVFYEGENKWETEWGVFTNDRKLKGSIEFNEMNC